MAAEDGEALLEQRSRQLEVALPRDDVRQIPEMEADSLRVAVGPGHRQSFLIELSSPLVVPALDRGAGQVAERVGDRPAVAGCPMENHPFLVEGHRGTVVALHLGKDPRTGEGIGAANRGLAR